MVVAISTIARVWLALRLNKPLITQRYLPMMEVFSRPILITFDLFSIVASFSVLLSSLKHCFCFQYPEENEYNKVRVYIYLLSVRNVCINGISSNFLYFIRWPIDSMRSFLSFLYSNINTIVVLRPKSI